MNKFLLTAPDLEFVIGTRVALALGVGLLVARKLSRTRRRRAGKTLVAIGAATTLPAVMTLVRGHHRAASRRFGFRLAA